MDSPDEEPFVYSFIEYPAGSPVGFFMAVVSLFPIFALSAYAVCLLSRRDLHTATLLVGQVANEAAAVGLPVEPLQALSAWPVEQVANG